MSRIEVGPVAVEIEAPTALVYQMLAAIGQGAQKDGERAEILERAGDELVCDFWTRVSLPAGRERLIRTRERVTLIPPHRIEYEHLDGPVRGLCESITLSTTAHGTTRLIYEGTYSSSGAFDHLRTLLLVRPAIHRAMDAHFADVRQRAETRAKRSRVFVTEQGG